MNRVIAIILALSMVFTFVACGKAAEPAANNSSNSAQPNTVNTANTTNEVPEQPDKTEEIIDDEGWDELEALGKVQTENGILTTTITMPADFAGEDITQKDLDEGAGENYISAKLNEDGSVTYKMTKKQHKAMLDGIVAGMEESFTSMTNGEDYSFTEIKHNKSFTQFDVTIKGEELGFMDSFAVMAFYMYGGIYGIFSGKTPEKIIVNFYNAKGELIETADSSAMK